MSDVLFLCTANICRSAYAEVRASMLAPHLSYSSAGIQGWTNHRMDDPMALVLAERGGDAHGFRSSRFRVPMARDARLVLTAEVRHRTAVLDELPAARNRTFTLGQLAAIVASAPDDLRGDELIRWAAGLRQPADPRYDVADPYRRGPQAAAQAADAIDAALAVILPRL